MNDWTAGYMADVDYTFGYYRELSPLRARLALLHAGFACPEFATACELGFGQGLSTNLHAAATAIAWHGTDFNPAQTAFAQELAEVAGAGAKLMDDSFAEFAARPDLPNFDYIGLHGIWTWISAGNRVVLTEFLRTKLNVGGVVYLGYNTMPGWAPSAPLRYLINRHADTLGASGNGIVSRVDGALAFAQQLMATKPAYARVNPIVEKRLESLHQQDRHYLAHEYFNRDWHPTYINEMAESLAPAKLDYVCSAHYLDHIDVLNMSAEQQAFLKTIPDPLFRETARDFIVNQQFRRDYWIKGARRLNPLQQLEGFRQHRIVLTKYRPNISLKVSGTLGEATMSDAVYQPILDFLADYKPHTLGEIELAVAGKSAGANQPPINFAQIVQAVMVLTGSGDMEVAQGDAAIAAAKKACDKINLHLMNKARGSDDFHYLASPVTGGALMIGRFQQLFLLARSQGKKESMEWARFVHGVLALHNEKIIKDGKALQTDTENLDELMLRAEKFALEELPVLKALRIA